jgi:hypothetical protein
MSAIFWCYEKAPSAGRRTNRAYNERLLLKTNAHRTKFGATFTYVYLWEGVEVGLFSLTLILVAGRSKKKKSYILSLWHCGPHGNVSIHCMDMIKTAFREHGTFCRYVSIIKWMQCFSARTQFKYQQFRPVWRTYYRLNNLWISDLGMKILSILPAHNEWWGFTAEWKFILRNWSFGLFRDSYKHIFWFYLINCFLWTKHFFTFKLGLAQYNFKKG